jgi:YbbR domain-containing protein
MKGLSHIRYWLFSLLGAVLLWTVAHSTSPVERPFDIPVQTSGVPDDLVVTGQDYDRVNIFVRGSRAGLASLSATDLVYVADLSAASRGRTSQEVDVITIEQGLPRGAEVVSRSPTSLEFVLERKHTRSVAIRADLSGGPAAGYQVNSVSVTPERATVTGARSEVLGLKEVLTETVDITGAQGSIQRRVKLLATGRDLWLDGIEEIEIQIDISPLPIEELADSESGETQG